MNNKEHNGDLSFEISKVQMSIALEMDRKITIGALGKSKFSLTEHIKDVLVL